MSTAEERCTTVTVNGRSWHIIVVEGKTRHECPRMYVRASHDATPRMYAYRLGRDWYVPERAEPALDHALIRAATQLSLVS